MMAARDRVMGVQQKLEEMEAEMESKKEAEKEAEMNRDRIEQLNRTIQMLVEKVNGMEKKNEA